MLAGFVEIAENGKIHCFGSSESLDIETRGEEDEIIIAKQLSGGRRLATNCWVTVGNLEEYGAENVRCSYFSLIDAERLQLDN